MAKVKICGLKRPKDALLAAKLGADFLGLIFSPKSLRVLTAKEAEKISQALLDYRKRSGKPIKLVGLFVDQPLAEVNAAIKKYGLDVVQLHGNESPAYCAKIVGAKVIKGFHMRSRQSLKAMRRYAVGEAGKEVWAFLLDSYTKGVSGGTGKQFDWELAKQVKQFHKPIFLAGGINAENVKVAIKAVKPYAVDLCSAVESAPGIKQQQKLINFFERI